jgi:hypothetical protein
VTIRKRHPVLSGWAGYEVGILILIIQLTFECESVMQRRAMSVLSVKTVRTARMTSCAL